MRLVVPTIVTILATPAGPAGVIRPNSGVGDVTARHANHTGKRSVVDTRRVPLRARIRVQNHRQRYTTRIRAVTHATLIHVATDTALSRRRQRAGAALTEHVHHHAAAATHATRVHWRRRVAAPSSRVHRRTRLTAPTRHTVHRTRRAAHAVHVHHTTARRQHWPTIRRLRHRNRADAARRTRPTRTAHARAV